MADDAFRPWSTRRIAQGLLRDANEGEAIAVFWCFRDADAWRDLIGNHLSDKEISKLTFDDVLKMGPEEGANLLRSIIGRELNHHDYRVRALTTIKIPVYKSGKIEDLLKLLQYEKEGKK